MSKAVEDFRGLSVSDAQNKIINAGLQSRVVGDGENIVSQMPEVGSKIYDGGVVVLYTDGQKATKQEVPDFTGMTVSEANEAAVYAGFNIAFEGTTLSDGGVVAYSQSVKPKEELPIGSTITVSFRNDTIVDF